MMKGITVVYNKTMKMSDLIDADYKLLLLLKRLRFSLGFGEKSVETICNQYQFDVDCFIFLANLQSNRSILNIEEEFAKLPLEPFIYYLGCSHEYFLENRLPHIRRKLKHVFTNYEKEVEELVLNFFDVYMNEVREHMQYEDRVVFPYVDSLISNNKDKTYSINIFKERHNDIEKKMTDLKRILMKYVSGISNQDLMVNILLELYISEEELAVHTYIEDQLVIPRVKNIEDNSK